MPITIVPPGRNASAAALQKIFEETQDKLIAEILRKRSKGYVDYAEVAALERVRKTLQKMVKGAEKYVPLAVEHEFYKRPESLQAYANARASVNPGRTRAVEILSDNLLGEVEEMAETAYQSTASKLFLVGRAQEDIFREAGLTKAIEASAAGRGSLTTVNEIIAAIQNTGITAFVDKAGHEWNLKAYGSMAVRTTVRQAQVAAVLTENQHDLYKIINTGVPCRWCAAYGGRVYSKSGMNKNYPPLTAAFGRIDTSGSDSIYNSFLNIHPNCMCTLVEYHEEDHSPEEVEKERLYSDPARRPFDLDYRTKAVKEAYEQKERNRAVYRANVKQYRRYVESGVPGMPKHFQTFLKHKKLNDDKYKEWMSAYRKADKPARVKPVPAPYPKPVKPVFVPEPAVPVPPVEIPKPVEAKPLKQITSFSEVESALRDDVGFTKVDPSVLKLNKESLVENTNQLLRLEDKFGVVHGGTCEITSWADSPGVNGRVTPLSDIKTNNMELNLAPREFKRRTAAINEGKNLIRQVGKKPNYFMPAPENQYTIYTVTHEYGHMVEFKYLSEVYSEMGLTKNPGMSTGDFANKILQIREETAKNIRKEIISIFEELNPGESHFEYMSKYSGTNSEEFFAEVFANSQLGSPNKLGEAMNEWIARKGLTSKWK